MTMCPFHAISLVERPADVPRPAEVKDDGKLAVIDDGVCRACGICAANCPELAIAHNMGDDAIYGRLATLTQGVDRPIVGFYCGECAGAAITLGGQHRDAYPSSVRLVEVPCIGRVSALHVVEAARLGAAGIFLAGCAEDRCHYRSGDSSAAEQKRVAEEALAEAGMAVPIEHWHLCAVDRLSVGRRIRMFHTRAVGDEISAELVAQEMQLIGATAVAGAGCEGGEPCGCGR
jgi:F420-non-reducing hydrogenase iron-sulfur subunit